MAEQAPPSYTDKATQIAGSLEDAALRGSKGEKDHDKALKKFQEEYQGLTPEQQKIFTKTVEDKLNTDKLFGLVALQDASRQLDDRHQLSKKDLNWSATVDELKHNPLKQHLEENVIQDYNKYRKMTNSLGMFYHENLNRDDIKLAMRPDIAIHNLFEKHSGDRCLYDKIKDDDGSISKDRVRRLLYDAKDSQHLFSLADRETLEWLKNQPGFSSIKADELKQHLKDAGKEEFAQYVHPGNSGYTRDEKVATSTAPSGVLNMNASETATTTRPAQTAADSLTPAQKAALLPETLSQAQKAALLEARQAPTQTPRPATESNPPTQTPRPATDSTPPNQTPRLATESNPPTQTPRPATDSTPPTQTPRPATESNTPIQTPRPTTDSHTPVLTPRPATESHHPAKPAEKHPDQDLDLLRDKLKKSGALTIKSGHGYDSAADKIVEMAGIRSHDLTKQDYKHLIDALKAANHLKSDHIIHGHLFKVDEHVLKTSIVQRLLKKLKEEPATAKKHTPDF
jgi:hypothetical protein